MRRHHLIKVGARTKLTLLTTFIFFLITVQSVVSTVNEKVVPISNSSLKARNHFFINSHQTRVVYVKLEISPGSGRGCLESR